MTMTTASLMARAHDGVVDEPDPAARPRRRSFTAEYKARILDEYDALPSGSSERGAMLRGEGLYAMDDAATGGELDRGGAVVGGVAVPVDEAADVAGVADEHRRDDRADPVDVGDGTARRGDGIAQASFRLLGLGLDPGDVVGQLRDQSQRS